MPGENSYKIERTEPTNKRKDGRAEVELYDSITANDMHAGMNYLS